MSGTRVCSSPMCAVGRPLVVADVALVSGLARRTDWGLSGSIAVRRTGRATATGRAVGVRQKRRPLLLR
jgi:hypothetical protein